MRSTSDTLQKGAALLAVLLSGCLGTYGGINNPDPNNPNNPGGDGGVVPVIDYTTAFENNVKPILQGACAGCHTNTPAIPPFLAAPMLDTILATPGLIGETPALSRLYSKGAHN